MLYLGYKNIKTKNGKSAKIIFTCFPIDQKDGFGYSVPMRSYFCEDGVKLPDNPSDIMKECRINFVSNAYGQARVVGVEIVK